MRELCKAATSRRSWSRAGCGDDRPLLLLDEPTRGVDVLAHGEIADAIRTVASSGAGIILVTDDYDELCTLADLVVVLVDGSIDGEVDGALDPVRVAWFAAPASPMR